MTVLTGILHGGGAGADLASGRPRVARALELLAEELLHVLPGHVHRRLDVADAVVRVHELLLVRRRLARVRTLEVHLGRDKGPNQDTEIDIWGWRGGGQERTGKRATEPGSCIPLALVETPQDSISLARAPSTPPSLPDV